MTFTWVHALVWLSGLVFGMVIRDILDRIPRGDAKEEKERDQFFPPKDKTPRRTRRVDKW